MSTDEDVYILFNLTQDKEYNSNTEYAAGNGDGWAKECIEGDILMANGLFYLVTGPYVSGVTTMPWLKYLSALDAIEMIEDRYARNA